MVEDTKNDQPSKVSNREEANFQLGESNLLSSPDGEISSQLETKKDEKLPTLIAKELDYPTKKETDTLKYVTKSNDENFNAIETNYTEGVSKLPVADVLNFTKVDNETSDGSYKQIPQRDNTVKIVETNKEPLKESLIPSRQFDFDKEQIGSTNLTPKPIESAPVNYINSQHSNMESSDQPTIQSIPNNTSRQILPPIQTELSDTQPQQIPPPIQIQESQSTVSIVPTAEQSPNLGVQLKPDSLYDFSSPQQKIPPPIQTVSDTLYETLNPFESGVRPPIETYQPQQPVQDNTQVNVVRMEPPLALPMRTVSDTLYETLNPFESGVRPPIETYQPQQPVQDNTQVNVVRMEPPRLQPTLLPPQSNGAAESYTEKSTTSSQQNTTIFQPPPRPLTVVKEDRSPPKRISQINDGEKSNAQSLREENENKKAETQSTSINETFNDQELDISTPSGYDEMGVKSNYNEVSSNPIKQRNPPLWRTSLG